MPVSGDIFASWMDAFGERYRPISATGRAVYFNQFQRFPNDAVFEEVAAIVFAEDHPRFPAPKVFLDRLAERNHPSRQWQRAALAPGADQYGPPPANLSQGFYFMRRCRERRWDMKYLGDDCWQISQPERTFQIQWNGRAWETPAHFSQTLATWLSDREKERQSYQPQNGFTSVGSELQSVTPP